MSNSLVRYNGALTSSPVPDSGTGDSPLAADLSLSDGPLDLGSILRRRWQLVLVATLLSAILAWVVGELFRTVLWRSEGVLVHTPLPIPENQKGVYTPPTPQTLLALIKSPKNLQTLRAEFGLAAPSKVLGDLIQVTQPRNAELIEIALDWPDPDKGSALVNRLLDLHIRDVAGMRKACIAEQLVGLERECGACAQRRTAAQQEHDRFIDSSNYHDARAESERTDRDISSLEVSLAVARQEHGRCLAQVEKWSALIREAKSKDDESAPADSALEEADPAYLATRKQLVDTLRGEKNKLAETEQKLQARNREHTLALSLLARGGISKSETDKLAEEMGLLALQKENLAQGVKQGSEELRALPLQYALRRKSELVEQSAALQAKGTEAEAAITGRRQQAREMGVFLRKADSLARKVKEVESEQLLLQGQLTALRQLRDSEATELAVAASASPASHPASSNRLKITLAAFVLPMLLFLGLLVGAEWGGNARTAGACARKLGLPVLARSFQDGNERLPSAGESARMVGTSHLALRVQRQLPDERGILLFASPNPERDGEGLVSHIGRHLALIGEKVLILDARGTADGVPPTPDLPPTPTRLSPDGASLSGSGLVQYLAADGQDVLDFIQPGAVQGVDYLPWGGPWSSVASPSARPLEQALRHLSGIYTRILILGPALSHTLETEILASHVDGIILTLHGPRANASPETERFVHYLRATGAPLLGVVLCP